MGSCTSSEAPTAPEQYTDTVYAYDPVTDTWSTMAPMLTARNSLSAVVDKGIIYVIGGYSGSPGRRPSKATTLLPIPGPKKLPCWWGSRPQTWVRLGGTILAAGGLSNSGVTGDNEGYNVKKNKWTELAADPTVRGASCAWRHRHAVLCCRRRPELRRNKHRQ